MAKKDEDNGQDDKIGKALGALKIPREHVFHASAKDDGRVVVVTVGGSKVVWAPGMKEEDIPRLGPVQIDGISRQPKAKPLVGRAK